MSQLPEVTVKSLVRSAPTILCLVTAAIFALSWGFAYLTLGESLSLPLGIIAAASLVILPSERVRVWLRSSFPARPVIQICFLVILLILAHAIGFSWFIPVVERYFGYPLIASVPLLALFGLYGSLQFLLHIPLTRLLARSDLRSVRLEAAVSWWILEQCFFRPFDWSLAHTVVEVPLLIQVADIGGAPLISALFIWSMALFCSAVGVLLEPPSGRRPWARYLGMATVVLLSVVAYGAVKISEFAPRSSADSLRVVIVQGSMPPSRDLSLAEARRLSKEYAGIPTAAEYAEADLVLWPESTLAEPLLDLRSLALVAELSDIGFNLDVPHIIGAKRGNPSDGADINAVGFFHPLHADWQFYDKLILFPGAEGSPFLALSSLMPSAPSRSVFELPLPARAPREHRLVRVMPLICFESIVAAFIRDRVLDAQPDLLVEASSTTWFSGTVAPRQHDVLARLRAVENRLPLLRAVNGGPSAVVDARGIVAARAAEGWRGSLQVEIPIHRGQLRLDQSSEVSPLTLFNRIGTLSLAAKALVVLLLLVMAFLRNFSGKPLSVPLNIVLIAALVALLWPLSMRSPRSPSVKWDSPLPPLEVEFLQRDLTRLSVTITPDFVGKVTPTERAQLTQLARLTSGGDSALIEQQRSRARQLLCGDAVLGAVLLGAAGGSAVGASGLQTASIRLSVPQSNPLGGSHGWLELRLPCGGSSPAPSQATN